MSGSARYKGWVNLGVRILLLVLENKLYFQHQDVFFTNVTTKSWGLTINLVFCILIYWYRKCVVNDCNIVSQGIVSKVLLTSAFVSPWPRVCTVFVVHVHTIGCSVNEAARCTGKHENNKVTNKLTMNNIDL